MQEPPSMNPDMQGFSFQEQVIFQDPDGVSGLDLEDGVPPDGDAGVFPGFESFPDLSLPAFAPASPALPPDSSLPPSPLFL